MTRRIPEILKSNPRLGYVACMMYSVGGHVYSVKGHMCVACMMYSGLGVACMMYSGSGVGGHMYSVTRHM